MNIVRNSRSLPEDVRDSLVRLAGKRMTREGELIIEARRFRTQDRNRQDPRSRLIELLRKAAEPVRPRKKTTSTRGSKERRLQGKRRRSRIKKVRRSISTSDP